MKEKAGVMKPPMTPNTKPSIYMFLNETCTCTYIHVHACPCSSGVTDQVLVSYDVREFDFLSLPILTLEPVNVSADYYHWGAGRPCLGGGERRGEGRGERERGE